jgi:hypothetical protein
MWVYTIAGLSESHEKILLKASEADENHSYALIPLYPKAILIMSLISKMIFLTTVFKKIIKYHACIIEAYFGIPEAQRDTS